MKPKDLKPPFQWNDRRVVFSSQEHLFFVPDYYTGPFDLLPAWSDPLIFDNTNPVLLEYCSGNGAWVIEKALMNPSVNWVAIEKRFDRVRKIWSKMHNHNLKNLFIICADARVMNKQYFASRSFDGIYINFPDPWPKKRHLKHRLIQPDFVKEMHSLLKPQAIVTLATDDLPLSEDAIRFFLDFNEFQSVYPKPYKVPYIEGYGSSYFQKLWESKGRDIYFHRFAHGKSGKENTSIYP